MRPEEREPLAFQLGEPDHEFPGAISGKAEPDRHASFKALPAKIRAMPSGKLVAWVLGPGGQSYYLTDPNQEGIQRIGRYIQNFENREPTEHVELKRMLEESGREHKMHVVDLSLPNIRMAQRAMNNSGLDRSNVRYWEGNIAESLPEDDDPHVISCHNVMFYMSPGYAARTLDDLLTRLRPGGVLALAKNDVTRMGINAFRATARKHNAAIENHGLSLLLCKRA